MSLHEVEVPVGLQRPRIVAARKRRLRRIVGRRVDVKVGVGFRVVVAEVALDPGHALPAKLAVD